MTNFNLELIRSLAFGDKEAHEQIKDLPLPQRMALGVAVNDLREAEGIIPMNNGLSIYEESDSKKADYDAIAESMKRMMDQQRENEEHAQRIKEEHMQKEIEYRTQRSRAGLTY